MKIQSGIMPEWGMVLLTSNWKRGTMKIIHRQDAKLLNTSERSDMFVAFANGSIQAVPFRGMPFRGMPLRRDAIDGLNGQE